MLGLAPTGHAQEKPPAPLRVAGMTPGGVRASATQNWGVFNFHVSNQSDEPRQARVVVSFTERPDDQYSRNVWVPPHASVASWLLAGPAPVREGRFSTEIEVLLFDCTDGTDRLVLPATEERIRNRLILSRPRTRSTTVMLDESVEEEFIYGQLPKPRSRDDEIYEFLQVFRAVRNASEHIDTVLSGALPPVPEAFEGVDHFVLASSRIARDPVGLRALRQWLERGGRVWVMLDLVDPEVARLLLGDAYDFQVIDRVSLTTTKIESMGDREDLEPPVTQEHERPVDLVRVLTPPNDKVVHTVNGWPAWFSRDVGRGKVVFSTLGARGWTRPRPPREASPFPRVPNLPVDLPPLTALAEAVDPPEPPPVLTQETLQPFLTEQIGYGIVDRPLVIGVFTLAMAMVIVLALVLRNARRPELVGWLGPAAALAATAAFFLIGESSRRAVAPTIAMVQVIQAVPGKPEAAVDGLLALYRPNSGDAAFGAKEGGLFELDLTGLEGQNRRFTLTDAGDWRWDKLSLPAGLRFAPLRSSLDLTGPLKAVARFGPQGLEGKIDLGPLEQPTDALLRTPQGRNVALILAQDGSFQATSAEALASGQFIAGAVLTDEQRLRQEVYRVVAPTDQRRQARSAAVMTWTKPADLGFELGGDLRQAGSALVIVPITLARSPAGQRVLIPGGFVPGHRIVQERETPITTQASLGADMELRFQLPHEVLPLEIERARLTAKITAASRQVTVAAQGPQGPVTLHQGTSPLETLTVDIDRPELLKVDARGGIALRLSIGDFVNAGDGARVDGSAEVQWRLEFIELDVIGRTLE